MGEEPTKQPTKPQAADHERLTSLINSMGDGVIAIDQNQKIILYNGAALNILDKNTAIQNSFLSSVLTIIDKNKQPVDIATIINNTKTAYFNRDYLLLYPDKSTINLYLSIAPVRLGYGQSDTGGYVVLLRDITREKSLEEERDEFISVVSHELRTPIAITEGNIGNAQMIAEKTGDMAQIKEALRQAHDQVLFLGDMINDLSTLSRAERGKLNVEVEAINVHDLILDLVHNYTSDAEKKGITIKTQIDPSLELLYSSKLYVREILQNFVTNAIKYTEEGYVQIEVQRSEKSVIFKITDTGIGIGKADKEKLFDKFFRSEDYRTRKNSGTGLGLYVTMKLATLIHAKISVDSELDKGSTFKISIPNLQKPIVKEK
ncbi:MAG TPA: ATP-binding protein [Candidatus Saccharibacteria bacterium]|nr:ATP-binding protein [Candidatus Saccharibacteria bacterium]